MKNPNPKDIANPQSNNHSLGKINFNIVLFVMKDPLPRSDRNLNHKSIKIIKSIRILLLQYFTIFYKAKNKRRSEHISDTILI